MKPQKIPSALEPIACLLKKAGWLPGRCVLLDLDLQDYPSLPPNIERIFNEFGDLKIPCLSQGIEVIPRDVEIVPMGGIFLQIAEEFGRRYGVPLFPIGMAYGSRLSLFSDSTDRVFLLSEDVMWKIAESFEEALTTLLLGQKISKSMEETYDPNELQIP